MHVSFDPLFNSHQVKIITSEILGKAKILKAKFESPEGKMLKFDGDYFGRKRAGDSTVAGPFAEAGPGKLILKVW